MKFILNGKEVSKEEFSKGADNDWLNKKPAMATTSAYSDHDPLMSDGLGCMKSQVQETRDIIKRHNIKGVKINPDGKAVITSRRGRNEFMKVRGLADADAGWGDY